MVDPENFREIKLLQIIEVPKAHQATTRNISFLKFRKKINLYILFYFTFLRYLDDIRRKVEKI